MYTYIKNKDTHPCFVLRLVMRGCGVKDATILHSRLRQSLHSLSPSLTLAHLTQLDHLDSRLCQLNIQPL